MAKRKRKIIPELDPSKGVAGAVSDAWLTDPAFEESLLSMSSDPKAIGKEIARRATESGIKGNDPRFVALVTRVAERVKAASPAVAAAATTIPGKLQPSTSPSGGIVDNPVNPNTMLARRETMGTHRPGPEPPGTAIQRVKARRVKARRVKPAQPRTTGAAAVKPEVGKMTWKGGALAAGIPMALVGVLDWVLGKYRQGRLQEKQIDVEREMMAGQQQMAGGQSQDMVTQALLGDATQLRQAQMASMYPQYGAVQAAQMAAQQQMQQQQMQQMRMQRLQQQLTGSELLVGGGQ
jgi:hypothetical protein